MYIRQQKSGNLAGLTRIWVHGKEVGTAGVVLMVNVGMVNETIAGLAHIIEHLLIGNESDGGRLKEAFMLKAVMNGYTTSDSVAYYMTLPADSVNTAIDILLHGVLEKRISKRALDNEKQVVNEEYHRNIDSPSSYLEDMTIAELYKGRPLYPTNSDMLKVTSSITTATIRNHRKKYYTPSNMILVVCSEHNPFKGRSNHTHDVAQFPSASLDSSLNSIHGSTHTPRLVTIPDKYTQSKQSHMQVAFPIKPYSDTRNQAAISLLSRIVGGRYSELFDDCRMKHHLVYSISSHLQNTRYGGYLLIHVAAEKRNIRAIYQRIKATLKRICDGNLAVPFETYHANYIYQLKQSITHSNINFALNAASQWMRFGIQQTPSDMLRTVEALTKADVLAIARNILVCDARVVVGITGDAKIIGQL